MKSVNTKGMKEEQLQGTKQEAQLLLAIKHPNLVSGYDVFFEKKQLKIVMDYCDGGDLE